MTESRMTVSQIVVLLLTVDCMKGEDTVLRFGRPSHTQADSESRPVSGHHGGHSDPSTCGYNSCDLGKDDMINVHLVPHSHDDVGWLKTVDQYYYGSHQKINLAAVQYILDSVIAQLRDDPTKRFIYVEIAFFYRWWQEQSDSLRHVVKGLVNQGRLEFILGGWCMNDEAATHYNAIIDQHTIGFRFLQRNFGECGRPKIGWQIDPFGHSREQASIFAQFGFDGLFFGRLDYQDKLERLKKKKMELMWMGSENLGQAASLFTGVNYNGYGPPAGFCFDIGCSDPPLMDDPRLQEYNVDDRIKLFLKDVRQQASNFTTNHIMMTMGSDFQFQSANNNYKNLDKLIRYVNEKQKTGSKVNLLYSTPSCYLYALNRANQTYSTKTDDFFPYASQAHTFWTGYFTSRPALKGYVRSTNNFLQVCKQLDVLSDLGPEYGSVLKLDILRQAMGVAQHHDAVSGTERQLVAYDYAKRLAHGVSECQDVINFAYSKLLPLSGTANVLTQDFCPLLNVSYCSASESYSKMAVVVYNPIGREVQYWVRLPVSLVPSQTYSVLDSKLQPVEAQIIPLSKETLNLPDHNGSKATHDLVFKSSLPPLGFTTYFVEKTTDMKIKKTFITGYHQSSGRDLEVGNAHVSLSFSGITGLLKSMRAGEHGDIPVTQSLLYYKAFKGNNSKPQFRASGAYIFRPNGSSPTPVAPNNMVKTHVISGPLVQEVHQVFSSWASQVYRIYNNSKYVEVEWTVGPIPFKDGIGREVISRYETDLASDKKFYTDGNGRELLERVRDYRPTWKLKQTESVAGNYYPVNSRILILDTARDLQLTVLTDRSQGGASIKDGQLELMVHRRLLVDDAYGVGEALNETGITGEGLVVRGKHYMLLDSISNSARQHRDKAEKLFMAPSLSFSRLDGTAQSYLQSYKVTWSSLSQALPDNVHLLTLEEWEASSFLLRLEHFYEKGEDPVLSQPAKVQLRGLFKPFTIKSVEELILGGNQKLADAHRLRWNVAGLGQTSNKMSDFVEPLDEVTLEVTLNPMQIRTFQVYV